MKILILSALLTGCLVKQRPEPPVHVTDLNGVLFYSESTAEGCAFLANVECSDPACELAFRATCGGTDVQVYVPSATYWPNAWSSCLDELDADTLGYWCEKVLP